MEAQDAMDTIRNWLSEEKMEMRVQEDARAHLHLLTKYPSGQNGHVFAIILPKGRDLVAISSMTRVDAGQQDAMKEMMDEEKDQWKAWVHDCRTNLIHTGVDWVIHLGHVGKKKPGPLQAFNVSEPIWYDGLTKNEFMQAMRRLWLAKLSVIHEIKYTFGRGIGKNGPVDDWKQRANASSSTGGPSQEKPKKIEMDETMSFGSDFDPSEWL